MQPISMQRHVGEEEPCLLSIDLTMQTGADDLMREAVTAGITMCFANPGTTELHMVQAVDRAAETGAMQAVLCLHETVAAGADSGLQVVASVCGCCISTEHNVLFR